MTDHRATESPAKPKVRPETDARERVPVEECAPPRPAAPDPAPPWAPSPLTSDLPPIAAKADDLEAIKKAVDSAASVGGGLWLSYLFVLFYLAVAAGAVTHADLFFEKPVKLPFLNIELPLLAFFFVAPLLFLVVHAYVLVHLTLLSERVQRFRQTLYGKIGPEEGVSKAEQDRRARIRDGLRRQLPSNIFVQLLARPEERKLVQHEGEKGSDRAFHALMHVVTWSTVVVAPVLLLLLIQLQFLPFHDPFITWVHRLALLVDLALLWWLWRRFLAGREVDTRHPRKFWASPIFGFALSFGVLLFSWTAATFPGEWQEEHLPSWRILPAMDEWGDPATEIDAYTKPRKPFGDWIVNARWVSLHDWLFNAAPDRFTGRRLPFSSTLVLSSLNVYEGLGIDDPQKANWRGYVFRARGRNLKGAIFDFASLPKVDFTGANLEGARLVEANFQGASLFETLLQGALLLRTQLQGALLNGANLKGASLQGANLQGASLDRAQLQGALLTEAHLEGASLQLARLQGAALVNSGACCLAARGANATRATAAVGGMRVPSLRVKRSNPAVVQDALLRSRTRGRWRRISCACGRVVASREAATAKPGGRAGLLRFARNDDCWRGGERSAVTLV